MVRLVKIDMERKNYENRTQESKCFYKGHYYYLIDNNGIPFDSFSQIKVARAHIKKYNHHKLPEYSLEEATGWSKSRYGYLMSEIIPIKNAGNHYNLNAKDIDKINHDLLINSNSGLVVEGMLSGSNTTGAFSKIKSSPMVISDGKYKGSLFVTGFAIMTDEIFSKQKRTEERLLFRDYDVIDLEQYFKEYPNLITYLNICNGIDVEDSKESDLGYMRLGRNVNQGVYVDISNKLLKDMDETLKYEYRVKDVRKRARKLRSLLRGALQKEAGKERYPSFLVGDNNDLNLLEAAHIISVEEIIKRTLSDEYSVKLDFSLISDKANGMLINRIDHTRFDLANKKIGDKRIYIDANGNMLDKKIRDKFLTKERLEVIELYRSLRQE